ncbi:folate family ECF transporter S component [Lachnoclostridium sp. Marseille-P6806]|uniref:folate family ECF transporter S component n=1 Tax=Lachnoclostridium sp. Marseille-P6806 TaxID=2364793 RepID=UPI001031E25F|nr:folate family ECF transporter S component [Lachnoclostridium sp. Marseille-P6806]
MKRYSPYALAYAGVLIAMNVVLSRLVSIPIGHSLRISVSSVPVMLGGLWLGPVFGGAIGFVGDMLGCAFSGYAPNPLITCSAVLTGVIPGLLGSFIRKGASVQGKLLRLLPVVAGMMMITSQGFTTLGISVMYRLPFGATWLTRIPQTLLLIPLNAFLTAVFYDRVRLPNLRENQ